MKHSLKDWIIATRPWSFTASAMPVIVTAAWMAANGRDVCWWLAALTVVNIILVHAAGNTWSDYHDYVKGIDTPDTYGAKTITTGQFTADEIRHLSELLNVVALALGITMVALTGTTLLWIGIIGFALSMLYPTLKYHALGDVVIIFCYSILPMLGTAFITTGTLYWDSLWMALPVGLITVGILHSNNTRDIETDTAADATTLPAIIGRPLAVKLYYAEVSLPYIWMIALCFAGIAPWWTLLCLLSLPLAIKNIKAMMLYKQGIKAYAHVDEATAQLQLAFSVLLIIGLILSQVI